MSTYSFGNPPAEALKLESILAALEALPDNTSKLISPKDVRDAVYTVWENIMFKPTQNSGGIEYIGIDKADFREKILIGKKTVGGVPVLSTSLLSATLTPQVDVFFYNTRTEPQSNYHTTVAFLAGTGSHLIGTNLASPYIKSTVKANIGFENTVDFEIKNTSYYMNGLTGYGGDIYIESEKGNIFINGIRYPTTANNQLAQNGDILKYKLVGLIPSAVWEAPVTFSSVTDLISPFTVSITGNPVILNGLPINFTDMNPTPVDIGGIPAGSTFSNLPVTELLRQILYPYIRPEVTSSFNFSLCEIGDIPQATSLRFNFQVKRNATYSLSVVNYFENGNPDVPTPVIPPPIPIPNPSFNTYVVDPAVNVTTLSSSTMSFEFITYSVVLQDTYPTTIAATSTLAVVIPWFYGSSTISGTQTSQIQQILGTMATPQLGKLTPFLYYPVLSQTSSYNKIIELNTLGLSGGNQGYIYFGYSAEYPDLQTIKDNNGNDVTNNFYKFNVNNVISPRGIWTTKDFKFYIFVGAASGSTTPLATTIGSAPDYNATYSFEFA